MQFRISIFSDDKAVTAPMATGILESDGVDFEEAAYGKMQVQGVTLDAHLKLTLGNPEQLDLYDEKL